MALTYASAIDDPARFRSSKQVGAHFGLTPKRYQSGQTDYTGRISKIGDAAVLDHLAQARASIVLWSALPCDWQDPDGWVERALDQCSALPWSLMVLHDLPTGAMAHLDRLIGMVADRGGRIRQEFPPDCLPMVDGEMRFGIENYLNTSS